MQSQLTPQPSFATLSMTVALEDLIAQENIRWVHFVRHISGLGNEMLKIVVSVSNAFQLS